MVIVRESPRAKLSPDKSTAQWPPKSPFQALLSSPSGRKKWQDRTTMERERSLSPSPMKKTQGSSRALQGLSRMSDDEEEERDDLDEEERQAQLELARIEAKLKLERIRQKRKLAAAGESRQSSERGSSRADLAAASPRKGLRPSMSQSQLQRPDIEVPLSPVRDRAAPSEQLSPARKRLGLNGPAKATDVSLKRARDGTQLNRSDSGRSVVNVDAPKPKSFNERLRATQRDAEDHEAKHDRLERTRSKGFGSQKSDARDAKLPPQNSSRSPVRRQDSVKRPSSVREMQSSAKLNSQPSVGRSSSTRSSQASTRQRPQASGLFRATGTSGSRPTSQHVDSDSDLSIAPAEEERSPSSYCAFSELHLSKRHIPHVDVARAMEDKEIYTLPRLLKEVKAPHYDPPDCEEDFVVFAIVASKSSPFDQKTKHRTNDENKPQEDAEAPRNKFMVLKLCDLKWEVDCFLFGTAFDQFWKLTPGTLLAILNPSILPPKTNQHSGRFSLKLGSSEDCVMEVGIARDLGYCTSLKKDGQQCGEWVDKRSTEICEFHLNLFIEKQRKGRMEVNTMWRGHGTEGDRTTKSRSREAGGFDRQMNKQKGVTQSREYGTLYAVNTGMGSSAANLLDAEDAEQLESLTEGEKSRKRIAEKQKERDLQRQLEKLNQGDSVGAEYMRTKNTATSTTRSRDIAAADAKALFEKPKAADLGLLNNTASGTHLSPAKDRKSHFGLGAGAISGRDAMGWGGARKPGLVQPKGNTRLGSPEKGQTKLSIDPPARPSAVRARSQDGSISPSKKKARFMLAEKGLREPGRESGGVQDLPLNQQVMDDDDDDLDIV